MYVCFGTEHLITVAHVRKKMILTKPNDDASRSEEKTPWGAALTGALVSILAGLAAAAESGICFFYY